MNNETRVIYRINNRDEVIFANRAWTRFAVANGGETLAGGRVLGRPLWDFIRDETVRQVYRDIVRRVRSGHTVTFNFRCDSPDLRRVAEMTVSLRKPDVVQFETRPLSTEKPSPSRFRMNSGRQSKPVTICAWCGDFKVGGVWQKVERAVADLSLLEHRELAALTHGICTECRRKISGGAEKKSAAADAS